MRPGGEVPGFKAAENSAYDWNADANQRWMLKAAQSRAGNDFIAEAFSNSPPYWMTASGCSSGGVNATDNNLKSDYYDDFADYLTDVVKYYRDNYGVTFRTLDPMNEPNTNYWAANGRQEGCHFDVPEQDKIIRETYKKLQDKNLLPTESTSGTAISAMDETSIDKCMSNFKGYSTDTQSKVTQINTHTYSGSDRAGLNAYAKSVNKKLWMSEVGIGGSVGHNHEAMNPALQLASYITKDVRTLGAEAWVYWQAVEDEANMLPTAENSNWGLIHADFDRQNENSYLTKQYYTMANYSRFIRPGYKIIESGNSNTLAAYDQASKKLVLVTYNNSTSDVNYKYDLRNFKSTSNAAEVYRTSPVEKLAQLAPASVSNGMLVTGLPAESVTTFVIPDVELNSTSTSTLMYYVDCGDANPSVLEDGEVLGSMQSNEEQPYGTDAVTNNKWGYIADDNSTWARTDGDYFNTLRQYNGNTAGKGLHYKFDIPNGDYNVTLGFLEPASWNTTDRYEDIIIEGTTKLTDYRCTSSTGEAKGFNGINVSDGELNIDIIKKSGSKPTISWIKVEKADQADTSISSISDIPAMAVTPGTAPVLPDSVTLTYADSTTASAIVAWDTIDPSKYSKPGAFVVHGTVQGTSLLVTAKVMVLSGKLKYYVDCTSGTSDIFGIYKAATPDLLNSVTDQPYAADPATNKHWGYTCDGGGATSGSDEYSSVRYDDANTPGKGINYKFDIPNGSYDVELGFKEIWSSQRPLDILLQGVTKATEYIPPASNDLKRFANIQVTDGTLNVDINRSATNTNPYADPVISWIAVYEHQNAAPVLLNVQDQTTFEGQALNFQLQGTDADNDTLTYSASGLPTGATLDAATGKFSWTPDLTQQGTYTVTFTVTDTNNATASATIKITVNENAVPSAPAGLKADKTYSKSIDLSWDKLSVPATYSLYRAASENGSYTEIYKGTDNTFKDRDLDSSTDYYYKVKAGNDLGESEYSPAVKVTTLEAQQLGYTEEQLKNNNYVVYFVNAGDTTPTTAESGDKLGLYSSSTEQAYGKDPVTGKQWGYDSSIKTGTNVSDSSDKTGSVRYYNDAQVRTKALKYKFELPEDYYDITVGVKNPWSGRKINLLVENNNVTGDYDIGSSVEKVIKYKAYVNDGELNVDIQGPSTGTLSNYNDPMVSYIIVKKHVVVPIADLKAKLNAALVQVAKVDVYSQYSIANLQKAIAEANSFIKEFEASGKDISDSTVQDNVAKNMSALDTAMAALSATKTYDSFTPGTVLTDTSGTPIQAHGGGVLKDGDTYYWYGEDKTNGYLPAKGVHVYSSKDLYNWKDEGLALTCIESADQFENDQNIKKLYEGRTDTTDILNDIGTNRIIERPKVIYNEKTKKYVMWMHTDGPTATSDANYAKAKAGYALSDYPTGPFIYQKSYRLDQCPADQSDKHPTDKGMSRDMNLFKDDDGTAYIIYSSEENLTMYISKLNDTYTDVTGWHKDGNVERDSTYKGVYGVDYVRVFPGAQREAPAVLKYKGKYYMISSGATGWAPNEGKYTVADSMFGEWKTMRTLCTGSKSNTTFDSQSTAVIPVDAANGKFIYMGDRWKESNLGDSRYIWLPVEFGQEDEIVLKWYDEWKLPLLDNMGKITVNTALTKNVTVGQIPAMPEKVNITTDDGKTADTPVTWAINSINFDNPGVYKLSGTLTSLNNRTISAQITVAPNNAVYFVHCGGVATSDYNTLKAAIGNSLINKDVIDQEYTSGSAISWGYGSGTDSSGDNTGDMFTSLRYLTSGNDINYTFSLDNGTYDVYIGMHDPWSQWANKRTADIIINGVTKTSAYKFSASKDVLKYTDISVKDGKLLLDVHKASDATNDPQISWIIISRHTATNGGSSYSGPSTTGNSNTPQTFVAGGVITSDNAMIDTTGATNRLKIGAADFSSALKDVKADAEGIKTVVVQVPKMENSKGYSVQLPKEALSSSNTVVKLVTNAGTISVPSSILSSITEAKTADTFEIVIDNVDKKSLSEKLKNEIGNRPVIDLSLKVNGKTVAWNNADVPVTVSVPYTATAEELKNKEHLTVWYLNDNGESVAIPNARYDEAKKVVTFKTNHFSKYAISFVKKSFGDLSEAVWAKNSIEILASKGIVDGRTNDSFAPRKNVTRGEFIKWLVRTLGINAKYDSNFADVSKTDSYYEEMAIAKAVGITSGIGNNMSGAEKEITRQDMMVLTAKALKLAKVDMTAGKPSDLSKFTDSSKISSYAKEYIAQMVASKIINGSGDKINPKGNTTRAEAAAMLYNIYSK
jgi:hypothetical protein